MPISSPAGQGGRFWAKAVSDEEASSAKTAADVRTI
jgi:hypothetical protein